MITIFSRTKGTQEHMIRIFIRLINVINEFYPGLYNETFRYRIITLLSKQTEMFNGFELLMHFQKRVHLHDNLPAFPTNSNSTRIKISLKYEVYLLLWFNITLLHGMALNNWVMNNRVFVLDLLFRKI